MGVEIKRKEIEKFSQKLERSSCTLIEKIQDELDSKNRPENKLKKSCILMT